MDLNNIPEYESVLDQVELGWLKEWAANQMCEVELQGTVGFMRNCVGIKHGSAYVDLPLYGTPEYEVDWKDVPNGPVDAYHKHDCLAVLVHDSGYFPATTAELPNLRDSDLEWVDPAAVVEAFGQLYDWCRRIDAAGFEVKIKGRTTYNQPGTFGAQIELLMGGTDQAYLGR